MQSRQPLLAYTALDRTGSSAVHKFYIHGSTEAAPAMVAGAQLRSKIAALSDCVITRQSVSYQQVELHPSTPTADSDLRSVGVFIFSTTIADQYAIVELPGIKPAMLMTTGAGAGILVDQAKPAIVALCAQLTAGLWRNHWGYALVELQAAFLQVRP